MLAYDAVAGIEEFKKLNRVIMEANPEIDVPIAGTYSLASAAKAHGRIEEGHVLGKSWSVSARPNFSPLIDSQ